MPLPALCPLRLSLYLYTLLPLLPLHLLDPVPQTPVLKKQPDFVLTLLKTQFHTFSPLTRVKASGAYEARSGLTYHSGLGLAHQPY